MSFETDSWPYVPARLQVKWDKKRPVRVIVMHDMEAPEKDKTAENVARYFQSAAAGGSAHICVDSDSIVQCVLDNNQAAGANGVNKDGIHVELAGYAEQTEAEWLDAYGLLMLERAAHAVAQYCMKYDIPAIQLTNEELVSGKKGIIGHYQASAVYKPNKGHNDPGNGFPWKFFLERVQVQVNVYRNLAAAKDAEELIFTQTGLPKD